MECLLDIFFFKYTINFVKADHIDSFLSDKYTGNCNAPSNLNLNILCLNCIEMETL